MTNAVAFHHVSKKFRRGQIHDSLRDLFGSAMSLVTGRQKHQGIASQFWALRDVSFSVNPGEALGIIGPNGAGKSTALKLLAGILRCDEGRIDVNGRLSALIEVGAGVHGDLTGRENIYLSGAILGMTRDEIGRKLDSIVDFSGLGDFLDTPVKRYSSGMVARLGFSVAAHVDPDVLLVDEVLSVGDVAFRQKCESRMQELVRGGTSLVFVSHNLEQIRMICHRVAVLEKGQVIFDGSPDKAIEYYLQATMGSIDQSSYKDCPDSSDSNGAVTGVEFSNAEGESIETITAREPVSAKIGIRLNEPIARLSAEISLRQAGGMLFVNFNSARENIWYDAPVGDSEIKVFWPALPVCGGTYLAQVRLWDADTCKLVAETPYQWRLQLDDRGRTTGMLTLPHRWDTTLAVTTEAEASGEKVAV